MTSEPRLQVVACRPKDLTELRKAFPELPDPHLYTGSIEAECDVCGQEIYIGPKAQEHLSKNKALVACFLCAAKTASQLKGMADLEPVDLGNTEFG